MIFISNRAIEKRAIENMTINVPKGLYSGGALQSTYRELSKLFEIIFKTSNPRPVLEKSLQDKHLPSSLDLVGNPSS